jgi:hypothetical protein
MAKRTPGALFPAGRADPDERYAARDYSMRRSRAIVMANDTDAPIDRCFAHGRFRARRF